MQLTRLRIQNFRGIGKLDLDLDPLTAIIGENNHGKTSIYDVLGLFLGAGQQLEDRRLRWDDFHRPDPSAKPRNVRVVMSFEEARDATPPPTSRAYRPALRREKGGVNRLHVEFTGDAETREIQSRFIDARGRPLTDLDVAAAVTALRKEHPVFLLRFAQPSGHPRSSHETGQAATEPDHRGRRGLEAQIARVYQELAKTRGPVPTRDLEDGLDAAHALYARLREKSPSANQPMRRMLDQLLDEPMYGRDHESHPQRTPRAGSGSHTLGLLMVIGALLDGRGNEVLPDGASPIVAIEEPEVHLHPTLLASTWDVIESLGVQTLVTTNSGELLSSMKMLQLRRLLRRDERIEARRLHAKTLDRTEARRVGYHIGAKRGSVLFARCWLLVEGETEFWILRQLAEVMGYDLEAEGVRIVEFAQCGVQPLVKLANDLGIEWHVLTDGDDSGASYANDAREEMNGARSGQRLTQLKERDLERCFWHHGYAEIYMSAANVTQKRQKSRDSLPPGRIIKKAVRRRSKPHLALLVGEAVAERGPEGVPPALASVIRTTIQMAREAIEDGTEAFDR